MISCKVKNRIYIYINKGLPGLSMEYLSKSSHRSSSFCSLAKLIAYVFCSSQSSVLVQKKLLNILNANSPKEIKSVATNPFNISKALNDEHQSLLIVAHSTQ